MIRSQPAQHGFELHEFDPFFNYRATQFVVENGIPAYLDWHDDMSWYPHGRDVVSTSQPMLHITAATLYQIFGAGSELYDFTIMFPVVIGSATTIVMFAIVRIIGGTTAGLLASLLFAISVPVLYRGLIGWFKSEPLGIFYGLLGVYFFLSGIKSNNGKSSLPKLVAGGVFFGLGISSWGGIQFFILPLALFFLALPFFRKDKKFLMWALPVFVFSLLASSSIFNTESFTLAIVDQESIPFISEFSTGVDIISSIGYGSAILIGTMGIALIILMIQKINQKHELRNGLAVLAVATIIGIAVLSSGFVELPAYRYVNALNPFLTTTDPLTDSVSEHSTPTLGITFFFFSILIVFAAIGAWLIFQNKVNRSIKIKTDMVMFALIMGLVGVYASSTFVRSEIFAAFSIIILSSIGISILASKILERKIFKDYTITAKATTKIAFVGGIIILLTLPLVFPLDNNMVSYATFAPAILTGNTPFGITTNDWKDAMQWLKENTPKDAVVASWWDYGYYITTLGERKTLADNATLIDWQIRKIASTLFSNPDNAWKILSSSWNEDVSPYYITLPYEPQERKLDVFKRWQNAVEGGEVPMLYNPSTDETLNPETLSQYPSIYDYFESEIYQLDGVFTGLDADYILVEVISEKFDESLANVPLYSLGPSGDETKKIWFARIAGISPGLFVHPDQFGTPNDRFWNETLLGHLIPFSPAIYIDPINQTESKTYQQGYVTLYVKDIKFPSNSDGPFKLVYASQSFHKTSAGPMISILIYEVNKDYSISYVMDWK
jgi:dolichyl-diphosphooligosaccharide--protein glycosyltransferase